LASTVEVDNLPGLTPAGGFPSKVSPFAKNCPFKGLEQVGEVPNAHEGASTEENIVNGAA
jgi:hypothetical protein